MNKVYCCYCCQCVCACVHVIAGVHLSVFASVHLLVFVSLRISLLVSVFVSLCVSEHVILVSVLAISFRSACLGGVHVGVHIMLAPVCVHHYLHARVCLAFSVSDTKYAFTPMQ